MSDGHVTSVRTYTVVLTILFALTALTVWVAFQDFGVMNTPLAVLIAMVKAAFVVSIFMHLRHSGALIGLVAASGAMFLAILFIFLMSDYWTRLPNAGW